MDEMEHIDIYTLRSIKFIYALNLLNNFNKNILHTYSLFEEMREKKERSESETEIEGEIFKFKKYPAVNNNGCYKNKIGLRVLCSRKKLYNSKRIEIAEN